MWHNFKINNQKSFESDENYGKNAYMLYSTVSSNILSAIAEKEGSIFNHTIFFLLTLITMI